MAGIPRQITSKESQNSLRSKGGQTTPATYAEWTKYSAKQPSSPSNTQAKRKSGKNKGKTGGRESSSPWKYDTQSGSLMPNLDPYNAGKAQDVNKDSTQDVKKDSTSTNTSGLLSPLLVKSNPSTQLESASAQDKMAPKSEALLVS